MNQNFNRQTYPNLKLTVFFPAFNEEGNIETSIAQALKIICDLKIGWWEIIVVDDGSADKTAEQVMTIHQKNPNVKLIRHPKNLGYGKAMLTGIKHARGDWFFMTDADLQFNLAELDRLLPYTNSADFIQGHRLVRRDVLYRVILGKCYRSLIQLLFRLPVKDPECSFRLIKTTLLKDIDIISAGAVVPAETVLRAKFKKAKFVDIGVSHKEREAGVSKALRVKVVLQSFFDLAKLRLTIGRMKHPKQFD